MTTNILDQYVSFLNRSHPLIRISITLFFAFVVGIGFPIRDRGRILLSHLVGSVLVLASVSAFVAWIFGADPRIGIIIFLYIVGQALRLFGAYLNNQEYSGK